MGQAYCRTSRLQWTVQQTINLTIFLIKIKQVLWTLKFHRANKVNQINKCIPAAFTCKPYRQDKTHRKTTASNFRMLRELRAHLVANKMQNRPGIILRAWTTLCLTDMLKTKTDICKFNNSNKTKTEMEVHWVHNRNSSSWALLRIWTTYKTYKLSALKTLTWTQWTFNSKRPSSTNHPLSAQLVISLEQPEHQQTALTITFMELPDHQIICNRQIKQTW